MRLTPKDLDQLTVFTLTESAWRRRARGRRLNLPEAMAIICDEIFEQAWDGRPLAAKVSGRRRFQAVSRTRGLKRSDMVRNGTTPRITVPPRGGPVLIDGRAARLEPATGVPLGQFYHIA